MNHSVIDMELTEGFRGCSTPKDAKFVSTRRKQRDCVNVSVNERGDDVFRGASCVPETHESERRTNGFGNERTDGVNYMPVNEYGSKGIGLREGNEVLHSAYERERMKGAYRVPIREHECLSREVDREGYSLENPVIKDRRVSIKSEPQCFTYSRENTTPSGSLHRPVIRPQHYSGASSWHEYLKHFENCATINGWEDRDKLMFLSASLVDNATSVLVGTQFSSYSGLCEALERRFGPAQAALCKSELRARRQRKGESYQSLSEDIRRLTILAYRDLPESAWQTMACEAFIDAMGSDEARRFVLQSIPTDLLSAVTAARQFDAIRARERDRKLDIPVQIRSVEGNARSELHSTIDNLAKQVEILSNNQVTMLNHLRELQGNRGPQQGFIPNYGYQNQVRPYSQEHFQSGGFQGNNAQDYPRFQKPRPQHSRCFRCNEEGHFARDCPLNSERRGGIATPPERQ